MNRDKNSLNSIFTRKSTANRAALARRALKRLFRHLVSAAAAGRSSWVPSGLVIRGKSRLRESLASLERCILMRRTFLSSRPDRGFIFDFDVNLLEKRQLLASYSYNSGTGLLTVQTDATNEQLSIISTSESGNYTITTTGTWLGSGAGVTDSGTNLYVNQPLGLASILIDDNNGTISGSGLSFGTSSANFVNHLTVNFTSATSGAITVGGSGASFINGANLSLTTTGNSISVTELIYANASSVVSLTGRNIVVMGNITTAAGDITLRGNNGSYQSGSFDGVRTSGSVISTSSGNILIDGRAAGGSLKYGVNLQSSYVNAGGAGCVTITGVSGNGSGMTYGMKLEAGACISTNNGSVNIDGNACGTGSDSTAVFLSPSSKITSTGLGDVFISGTVSNGTNHQFGIYSQANITTSTGSINFNGISCGTGNYSWGVALLGSLGTGYISANGTGNVTITGTAANGTDQARGIMTSGASITTNSGSITFNGISCGTGINSTGVSLAASNISAFGIGNLTITGKAQNGTTFACGIFVTGSSITTNSGSLNLNGTSCVTGDDSFGVDLNSSTIVSSTGAGDVFITGTSKNCGNWSTGIAITATVTTNTGNLTINGIANGTGMGRVGVQVFPTSSIAASGSGNVTIIGVGANSTDNSGGVAIGNGSITTITGAITINGSSCCTGNYSVGVSLYESNISATGNGNVTITGRSEGNLSSGLGIQSYNSGSKIYSNAGLITLTANSMNLTGIVDATLAGNVLIQTLGAGVNLGGADSSANLGLTSAEIGQITANRLTIGNSTQGNISVTSTVSVPANTSLALVANIASSCISVGSALSATGTGAISLTSRNISVTGNITAQAGDITLYGNGGGNYQAGSFDGVCISGSAVNVNTTSGNITIDGRGSSSTDNSGVNLASSKVQAGGSGCVTITGVSGNGSTNGAYGVFARGSSVTTSSGSITVNGTSCGTGTNPTGVFMYTACMSATGTGNVTITGTATNGTVSAWGVEVYNFSSVITNSGSITVNGTSCSTGTNSMGILLQFTANVSAIGGGNVTIAGSTPGNPSAGIGLYYHDAASKVYSNGGLITVTANSISLTGTLDATAAGDVLIQTLGAGVNLGGADDSSSLGLTSTELGQITANLLTIGNSTTGNVVISSDLSWPTNFTLNTGTLLSGTLNANTLTQGSSSLTSTGRLTANPLSYSILVTAGSPVTYGTNLLLTATLTHSGTSFNTGTISFYNDGSLLGTGNISGDVATYSWAGAGAATYSNITATGNVTFAASSGTNTATATVNPYSLTVTANGQTKAYGADVPTLTYTNTPLVYGDTASVFTGNLATTGLANSGVGNYSISQGNLSAGSNYSISYTSSNLSVTPYSLTVSANAQTKDYGALVPTLTFANTSLVNGDTSSVFLGNLATSGTANSGVGNYLISQGNLSAGANYSITYTSSNLSVTPYSLTVTADAQTKVYGASVPNLTYTATLVNGDTDSVFSGNLTTTGTANSGVGNYSISQGNLSAGANYSISYTSSNLSVTPYSLTVTADAQTKIYGPSFPSLTYTNATLVNGDTDSVFSGNLTTTGTANSGVGNYTINLGDLSAGSNYSINYSSANLSVTPYGLNVTANAQTKDYGASVPALTFTNTALVNGDTLSVFSGNLTTSGTANSGVGNYSINQGNLSAGSNYSISFTSSNLSVTPYSLTVTADAQAKDYGALVPNLTYSATLVNGDTNSVFTGNLTTSGTANSGVGNYSINQGNLSAGSNYSISYTSSNLSVTPYSLNVSADAQTKVYGASVPSLTYTNATLVNGDTDSIFSGNLTTTGTANSGVGNYTITLGNLSAGANYSISYTSSNLSVTPYGITLTADNQAKTYGLDGPTLTYTNSTLVNGDTETVFIGNLATSGNASANIGIYAITQGNLTAGANYSISYVGSNITISPANLAITSSNVTKIYGSVPEFAYSNGTLYNSDAIGSVKFTSSGNATSANIGIYGIAASNATLSSGNISNYNITYISSGILTVNRANLTITAVNLGHVYGSVESLQYSNGTLYNSDTIGSVNLTSAGNVLTANVGSYAIAVSNATLSTGNISNYNLTYANGTLTVSQANLTITSIGNKTKIYGAGLALNNSTGYSNTTLYNNDTIGSIQLYSDGTALTSNVGTYDVVPANLILGNTGVGNISNYNVTYVSNANVTINPANLAITSSNASKTYGSTTVLAYTNGTLYNSDSIGSVELSSSGASVSANIGTYAVNVANAIFSTGNISNYNITYRSTGNLTVNQANLTLKAGNQTKNFGANYSLGTTCFTLTGSLYNGDTISGATLTAPQAGNTTSPIGNYNITSSSAVAGSSGNANISNYNMTYQNGTLNVIEAVSTVVTSTGDVVDPNDGNVTLREAIVYATQLTGTQVITFSPSIFVSNRATISLSNGTLTVNDTDGSITIQGPTSANTLTVSGANTSGIFNVYTPLTITNITLSNGAGASGSSPNLFGGAIYSNTTLSLANVNINNSTANYGSAIYQSGGSLGISNSNIVNSIYVSNSGSLSFTGNQSLTLGQITASSMSVNLTTGSIS